VLFHSVKRPGGLAELAADVHRLSLAVGERTLDAGMILDDIQSGLAAWRSWKNSKSRPFAPRDVTHLEFWSDFVAADWPAQAREIVQTNASHLCYRLGELEADRALRPGSADLLRFADENGVLVGVVSNSLCGRVHRDAAEEAGATPYLGVQIYSDECLVRKPNPEMIYLAARALEVGVERCWYVGDTIDRDVLCGRRAGVGCSVLMVGEDTYDVPYKVRVEPDLVVQDVPELLSVLQRLVGGAAGIGASAHDFEPAAVVEVDP